MRLGRGVDQIDENGVVVAGERIAAKTVIWTAGVTPSPAGKWLGVETDRAGRVRVGNDVSVPGRPGSLCHRRYRSVRAGWKTSSGRRAGRHPARTLRGKVDSPPDCRATADATVSILRQRKYGGGGEGLRGPREGQGPAQRAFAWLVWAAVHLQFLAMRHLRVSVFLQWVWTGVTGQRGSRLIMSSQPSAHHPKRTCVESPPIAIRESTVKPALTAVGR